MPERTPGRALIARALRGVPSQLLGRFCCGQHPYAMAEQPREVLPIVCHEDIGVIVQMPVINREAAAFVPDSEHLLVVETQQA